MHGAMSYRRFAARHTQRGLVPKGRIRQRGPVSKRRQKQNVTPLPSSDLEEEEQWRSYAEEEAASPGPCEEQEAEEAVPGLLAVKAAPGACVLLIPSEQKLTFTGKCHMTCLYGRVHVFGFTINDGQPPYTLYSAHTHNALTVEALPYTKSGKSKKEMRKEARAILREYLPIASRRTLMAQFTPLCSLLLLEGLEDATTSFILGHPEYAKIFTPKLNEKNCCISPEEAALTSAGIVKLHAGCVHMKSESFTAATEELIRACIEDDTCPIILVCGPKNVGKSTFNRHLINQLLNQIPCVDYLECDMGQTEFTPPGCVSLLKVTDPLLGPPFSHQREPRRMVYYGEASCENDLERYIEAVKHVLTSYKREVPLIVNTMGWVKGFGLLLLIDLIRLFSPSHIVQMCVRDLEDMPRLTPKYTRETCGLHTKGKAQKRSKNMDESAEVEEPMDEEETEGDDDDEEEDDDDEEDDEEEEEDAEEEEEDGDSLHLETSTQHKLLSVSSEFSAAGDSNNMRCHSHILRDLSILGYLSKLQPPEFERPLPLNHLIPYEVPFNAVALRIIHADVAPAHILYSFNASWVGLCSLLDDVRFESDGPVLLEQTPICDCLGFGVVRSIDMERKVYHILTPVTPSRLRLVNCLLLGSVTLPRSVFKNQPAIKGDAPYVTTEYNFEISGAGKIKLNKQLKRREHHRMLGP